ncbi:unnamed protein product [Zymoseptoria tritici ST99CH_3D1]|nr:unnamed protein product [Zymoseptoria tritici ST99CH_3D1]
MRPMPSLNLHHTYIPLLTRPASYTSIDSILLSRLSLESSDSAQFIGFSSRPSPRGSRRERLGAWYRRERAEQKAIFKGLERFHVF